MNAVLYGVDTRAARRSRNLTEAIGEEEILERCGNALTSQSVGPKILWLKRNRPEIFARTAKILTSTSFLVHRLTGRYAIDHYSAADSSPFYLVDRLDWSDGARPRHRSTSSCCPTCCGRPSIAGRVHDHAADETGLAQGTPVIAGTIDAAAEAVSVGVARRRAT